MNTFHCIFVQMRAVNIFFLLFGSFVSNVSFGQLIYGGPSAVTYSPDSKMYYVVNQVTKDVNEMDRWGKGRSFITKGLNSPTNILYANLPIGAGFLILDSNQVHLFDTSGFQLGSENVSGAQQLQDLVFDKQNEVLYTTDIKRNVIYKTIFGPPPFYIPSTSIFADSLRSPAGLYLDKSNNRLLYTEFVDSSNIKTVNLNNGSIGTLAQTSLDSIIAIDKDLQGNYYLSSQGNKGVYVWNKYLAGTPKKVFYEPKPSDFMINTLTDEWAYLCYSCGKVYIVDLHIEGPLYEDRSCPGDSVAVYLNSGLKTIGTYDQGNKFIAELSGLNMSFAPGNTTVIGEVLDTLRPSMGIPSFIPARLKAGMYKLRIRTTKPVGTSRFELFQINSLPSAEAYTADTASVCNGSVLSLGIGNDSTIAYQWSPSALVSDDTAANPIYIGASNQWVTLNTKDENTGCLNRDSVFVLTITQPKVSAFPDTLNGCLGDSLKLGVENKDYQFNWSPGSFLSDSTISNPIYTNAGDLTFSCFYSAIGGCSNSFEQTAIINEKPTVELGVKEMFFCPNEDKKNEIILSVNALIFDSSKYFLNWTNGGALVNKSVLEVSLSDLGSNIFTVQNKATFCISNDTLEVYSFDSLKIDLNRIGPDSLLVSVVGNPGIAIYTWYKNNTLLNGVNGSLFVAKDSGEYFVRIQTNDSCFFESQRIKYVKATNGLKSISTKVSDFYVYQTDLGTELMSKGDCKGEVTLRIYSLNGQFMRELKAITLPFLIDDYTSPGLNIAYVRAHNKPVQKIKFIQLD